MNEAVFGSIVSFIWTIADDVLRALERRSLLTENRALRAQLGTMREMPLIGSSESIAQMVKLFSCSGPDVSLHSYVSLPICPF